MVSGDDFTNPFVSGMQLAFYYEAVRAVSNGIVRLFFGTNIDDWMADKIGAAAKSSWET